MSNIEMTDEQKQAVELSLVERLSSVVYEALKTTQTGVHVSKRELFINEDFCLGADEDELEGF